MNLKENLINFYKNSSHNNLYLSALPAFFAIIAANNIFKFNLLNGLLILFACVMAQLSVQILDDYFDWITSKTTKRLELEQTGIRGLYTKSAHFLIDKKLPRKYFYIALLFAIISILIFIFVSIISKNLIVLLFLIPLPIFLLINYHHKFNKIMNFIGTEFMSAVFCSFLTMLCVFYSCTKCITMSVIFTALIVFCFTYNILYTASLLNLKPDIMTEKTTMPIILNNENKQLAFSVFLTLFPFIILPIGVYYNILSKSSIIAELLIFHSIWFIYLIYLFIKQPQKPIKWHFMMGVSKDEIENEQSSIGWYTVRYDFIKNIYIIFVFVLIISLINWKEIFMF